MPRIRIEGAVQTPRVSVYMDDVNEDDMDEIAGMLRGLACAIDGFEGVTNMTNDRFWAESPVIWNFRDAGKAEYFKSCVEYYFAEGILGALKVKRRFKKT